MEALHEQAEFLLGSAGGEGREPGGETAERTDGGVSEPEREMVVEIVLEMNRGLVEQTQKNRMTESSNQELPKFGEAPRSEVGGVEERPPASQLEVLLAARQAVQQKTRAGTERSSPAVWAAVKALSGNTVYIPAKSKLSSRFPNCKEQPD